MNKCPQCNRVYSNLIKTCPSCNVPLLANSQNTPRYTSESIDNFGDIMPKEQENDISNRCPKCGANLARGTHFCVNCGARVSNDFVQDDIGIGASGIVNNPNEIYQDSKYNDDNKINLENNTNNNPLPNNNPVPPKKSNKSAVIIGVVAAVCILGAGAYFMLRPDPAIEQINSLNKKIELLSTTNKNNFAELQRLVGEIEKLKAGKGAKVTEIKVDPGYYVMKANKFNNDITGCAQAINGYLKSHSDLQGASHILRRCRDVRAQIAEDRGKFVRDYGNKSERFYVLLRQLYDLQLDRIDGLTQGVDEGLVGRDFMPFFQKGTAASYHYDDVEKEFNRTARPR